ncbi:14298_t:CDS:2 [Entrophospora sp. SA101]|nr:14298_t:CDS:2 [Entrophospora sp. SA101]
MSYELRDQVSKYIGFNPEEIRLPVTDEDRQLFQELIADQEKMIDIVMDEYRFLLHHGHNYKGGESIHIMWVYICTEKDAEKVLIDVPPSKILSRKVLAHIEKRFKDLPLAPVFIIQELKFRISNLEKRLQKALVDIEHKEDSLVISDSRINELQEEINTLKNRIRDLTSRKNKKLSMSQVSNMNETRTIVESVRNAFNNIDSVLRRIPGLPRNIESEFTDIKNAVTRLQGVANREKNRADQIQVQVARLRREIKASEDENALSLMAYNNEKEARRSWYFSYKDKHRRVGEMIREKFAYKFLIRHYAKKLKECQDHGKALNFKLNSIEKAKNKQLLQKHLSEWEYKTREAKGLTIKVPMPNSPDFSSSFYSDSSDTGSLTGGMRQKFDTIHRHSRRTSDILGNIEEELHSSDNEDSENSSNSIIIEGTSNTDIPPLFNDPNSSSSDDSDDEEIRSLSSSDDDIHTSCRQIHIQNIRLRRKAEQDLLECRNEKGLLEFNRDRLVNDLEIAEDDIIDQNRIINILNQENLLLRNNNPHINNNRTGMVGYELKKFHGSPTEDPEEHIEEFRLWLVGSGIDVGAGHANRINAHGVFIASLKGDAKDWYERTIHGKNWELRNLLDNTAQANLGAVQGQNAGQLGAQALNRANGQNGNVIIPAHTVFDEDWSFADGRPTDRLPNAPNTNTGNTVVVPGIRLGQVLYWFRTNYPTVTAEKQRVLFGSTVQGSDPVGRFYSNLRRLARLAGIDVQQIRLQFIRGLSPANQIEVRRLGLEKSVDELLPKLEEIERYTAEQLSGAYLRPISDPTSTNKIRNKDNVSDNTGMTETDIKNLVKSMISSSEQDESSQIHERKLLRPSQMEPGKIYRGPGLRLNDQEWLRMDEATDRLSALAGPSYLQTFMDKISKGIMDRITPLLPQKKKNTSNDGMDEITNGMAELSINNAIAKGIEAGVNAVIKSSKHRCSNCNRTGHNSRKCTRKKRSKSRSKKRGSVNKVAVDSGSDTNSSNNDSSDNNSDSGDSSSEVESDHSFDSGSKKRQSLESPIQRSSQKIQKKSAQDDKPSVSDQISQEAECDEDKNVPFEKWCAPADFSSDFDDPSLKKNA